MGYLCNYYKIEFFQDVGGHDGYGKYGHCWTVREDRVISLEGAENVCKIFVFK